MDQNKYYIMPIYYCSGFQCGGHGTHLFQTDEAGQILFLCVSELALLSSLFVPPVEQNIELWLALVLIHQTQTFY